MACVLETTMIRILGFLQIMYTAKLTVIVVDLACSGGVFTMSRSLSPGS